MDDELKKTIYFDGGCKPNPGAMEVAAVVKGASIREHQRLGQHGTNNEAEWLALLMAMDVAVRNGFRDVEFVGDSMLVVNQAKGTWKAKDKWVPYHALMKEMAAKLGKVSFRQVPRNENPAGHFIEEQN